MILVTKKGFRLWRSGMLVTIVVMAFGVAMPYLEMSEASLGVQAIYYLIAFPMAIGWTQRWFWS